MINKLDITERALHHQKVALLENRPVGDYLIQMLLTDISNKINEVIDAQNNPGGVEAPQSPQDLNMLDNVYRLNQRRTPAENEVIRQFVNHGESCITINATDLLKPSADITGYDVVFVKQVDGETSSFKAVATKGLELAKKRAIFGIHESILDDWNQYMPRIPFHWEHYEYQGSPVQYYVIDKLEGSLA